jgi:hypothetical protein
MPVHLAGQISKIQSIRLGSRSLSLPVSTMIPMSIFIQRMIAYTKIGYMAHQCVSATTRAGAELGYDISVVQDAIGDRHLPGAKAEELVRVSRNRYSIFL